MLKFVDRTLFLKPMVISGYSVLKRGVTRPADFHELHGTLVLADNFGFSGATLRIVGIKSEIFDPFLSARHFDLLQFQGANRCRIGISRFWY
jgi:hypothetical protein